MNGLLLLLSALIFTVCTSPIAAIASDFDIYSADIISIKIGMDRNEVIEALNKNNLTLPGLNAKGDKIAKDLMYTMTDKIYGIKEADGSKTKYRTFETAIPLDKKNEDISEITIDFTSPTPGIKSVVWAIKYTTRYGKDIPTEEIMASIKEKYGEPNKPKEDNMVNIMSDMVTMYYGDVDSLSGFHQVARYVKNSGMHVSIHPGGVPMFGTKEEPGTIIFSLGDIELWKKHEQAYHEYLHPPKPKVTDITKPKF